MDFMAMFFRKKPKGKEPAAHCCYCGFDITLLPEELFVQVLVFVPAIDVVKNCALVNKYWRRVTTDPSLWRQKCERTGRYVADVMGPPPDNFMVYYFRNPYTRNLLKNYRATEGLAHWKRTGSSVEVEEKPSGSDPITDYVPAKLIAGQAVICWVTSYREGFLTQQVILMDEGCSEVVLDRIRPPIKVFAWCSARWDCGSMFFLRVKLLDEAGQQVPRVTEDTEIQLEKDLGNIRRAWHKVEHTFEDYPPGVRSVEFTMGGVDTQFWAGNYGSKFTLPCLCFEFKD